MQTIPLNKLDLSDSNVRKTSNPAADEQLSYDIEGHGLLQNLIVTKGSKRGRFAVIAGGRRLRAMQMIIERGAWPAEREVNCEVIDGADHDIGEVSLAENFSRLAMSPAEECRAFQHFIGQDGDSAAVAKRFGLTQRFVDGRLRLANLAEPIFEALASGAMTLDVAKAYASTDQHEVQLRVFEQTRHHYHVTADSVRRLIADGSLRGTDAIALLVGETDYVAAGGRIERDLFSEAADDRWIDAGIAEQLATAKMEGEAQRLTDELGIGWVHAVTAISSWNARSEYDLHPVRLPPAPISAEAQARIDAIEARMDEINGIFDAQEIEGDEDDSDFDGTALEQEYEALDGERSDLSNPARELPQEWRQEVGHFLILDRQGKMVLEPDYYSAKRLRFEEDENGNISGGAIIGEASGRGQNNTPSKPEATAPGGKPVSAKLFDELAVQRRNILAASLLGDRGLALDYAIFALCDVHSYHSKGTTIHGGKAHDPANGDVPTSQAEDIIAQACEDLTKGWQEQKSMVERFTAFRALDDDAKAAWLAYAVAISLEAKAGYGSEYNPIHALLGTLLDIDVASLWRPTSENFFDRVNKTACLAALTEVGGSELAARYSASKKSDLSASCHRLFAGDAIVEPEIKERALAWIPQAMRFDMETPAAPDIEPMADSDQDSEGDIIDDEAVYSTNYDDALVDTAAETDADAEEVIAA